MMSANYNGLSLRYNETRKDKLTATAVLPRRALYEQPLTVPTPFPWLLAPPHVWGPHLQL